MKPHYRSKKRRKIQEKTTTAKKKDTRKKKVTHTLDQESDEDKTITVKKNALDLENDQNNDHQ